MDEYQITCPLSWIQQSPAAACVRPMDRYYNVVSL